MIPVHIISWQNCFLFAKTIENVPFVTFGKIVEIVQKFWPILLSQVAINGQLSELGLLFPQAINGEPIGSQSQWIVANKLVGDRNTQVTITVQTPGEGMHWFSFWSFFVIW